jgi:hypothetical protein
MGGVTAELFKDTTMRLVPSEGGLSQEQALSMARNLVTWPLLDGFRALHNGFKLDLGVPGKNGEMYKARAGLAFETQHFRRVPISLTFLKARFAQMKFTGNTRSIAFEFTTRCRRARTFLRIGPNIPEVPSPPC